MTLTLALLPLMAVSCVDYNVVLHDNTDVFYQDPEAEVDILLVVDNSCSMQPYQEKLATNFDEFIRFFDAADVDYQIGVVTTGVPPAALNTASGCTQQVINNLPGPGELVSGTIITPATTDAAQIFSDVVNVGICGSGSEMGLEAGYLALTEPNISTVNEGFLRLDASLSIIFVSDEEDFSPRPVNEYINAFRDVKGHRARDVYNASALVMTDTAECSLSQSNNGSIGSRYLDVAAQSSGVIGNICDNDFESIVTELSLNSSRLLNTFYLSQMPSPSSLQVMVNEVEIGCDEGVWEYVEIPPTDSLVALDTGLETDTAAPADELRPAVQFAIDQIPAADSQIAIRYDGGHGGTEDWCTPVETVTDTASATE